MDHRILFAIGGDAASQDAVGAVVAHARMLDAAVRVLYVRRAGSPEPWGGRWGPLEQVLGRVKRGGVRADGETCFARTDDDVGRIVWRAAGLRAADVVAIGTNGGSDVGGAVLDGGGPQLEPAGLLVVRTVPGVASPPRRILVAVDGPRVADDAVVQAGEMARRSDAQVRVLHVVPAATVEAYRSVDASIDWLRERDIPARGDVALADRDPADAIVGAASRLRSDLVVVSSRRRLDASRDLVRRVVHRLPGPVLVPYSWNANGTRATA